MVDAFVTAKPRGLTAPPPAPVLRLGSSGEAVKALQRQLNDLGESVLASGQYGPRTLEAVRRFQVAKGIQPASGMVDAATQRALAELKALGNPRTIPRAPRKADWFDQAAQTVSDAEATSPGDVTLMLIDGRELTVERAIEVVNDAYTKLLDGGPPDPYDDRDVIVTQINREERKLRKKGYLTAADRTQLGLTLKRAFELFGEVDVLSVGGAAKKPAVIREE